MAPCGTDQHPCYRAIYVEQADPAVGNLIFSDLIRMTHAARLQHVKTAVTFPVGLERAERNPGVDQGWDALISAPYVFFFGSEPGHYCSDALCLENIDHAKQATVDF